VAAQDSLTDTLFAGRFRIQALLGKGGMGAVYLARHEVLGRLFAIKVILRGLSGDADIQARFRREARAASRIEHPHITSVFDFGYTDEGRPYIAMEYVDGPSLAAVLKREGRLPISRAVHVLRQITEALAAAHAGQVIHRDLKPANIVLTTHRDESDYVKVLDFGMAKILGTSSGLTLDGHTFGTPEYMAPEQCLTSSVDHRADLYSFGIIAFEALVGRVPFGGKTLTELLAAHIQEDAPVPSKAAGFDLPPLLDRMVLRCMAKRPEDRYPSAHTILAELDGLAAAMDPAASTVHRRRSSGITLSSISPGPASMAFDVPNFIAKETCAETEESWTDPTSTDGPENLDTRRARAIEELAHAVRERGLGSPEISRVLSFKLEVEDQLLEVEAEIGSLCSRAAEREATAREREARLRQVLNRLEHEKALAARSDGGVDAVAKTLPLGLAPLAIAIGAETDLARRARDFEHKLLAIRSDLEAELARIDERRAGKEEEGVRLRSIVAGHTQALSALLLQARTAVTATGDQELERLFLLAAL
jgi:serine/threonine protein kinase